MKLLILYLSIGLVFSSCQSSRNNFTGIKVTHILPVFNSNGSVLRSDTGCIYVYYYKNIEVWKLYYNLQKLTIGEPPGLSTYQEHIFIFEKNNTWGYDYDTIRSSKGIYTPVDSIFKYEWAVQNNFYEIFNGTNEVRLINKQENNNGKTIKETYSLKDIADTNHKGSVSLEYYKPYNNIRYSFAKELDSLKKMKLIKIHLVNDAMKFSNNTTLARFETIYSMQKIDSIDEKEILGYIQRFKADEGTAK